MTGELSNIIPLAGLLLLIMLSGYLIIYNLFYISVVKDTRFYGLLKTIGTMAKQLKILIFKQAVMLSVTGIPLGLIRGYILGVALLEYVMQILTISHTAISVNPIIFIGICNTFIKLISKNVNNTLEALSQTIESMLDDNPIDTFSTIEDTILSKLQSQIIRLSDILKSHSIKLKKEKDAITELISDISHQLKTPLANLNLYNSLLLNENLDNDKRLFLIFWIMQ